MAAIVKSYKAKLPYDTYLDVMQCVDGSNLHLLTKQCFKIDGKGEDKSGEDSQIKASFSINPNFKDLCETLDQQVNYVLKVKAECITNQGILSCLQCIENQQAINLILRLTVHQKTKIINPEVDEEKHFEAYNSISSTTWTKSDPLHFISVVEYGREMIFLLSFTSENENTRKYIHRELVSCFRLEKGSFDESKCQDILNTMKRLDQSYSGGLYTDFQCRITSMSFTSIKPASFEDVAVAVRDFFQQTWSNNEENIPLGCDDTTITADTTKPHINPSQETDRKSKLFPLRITLQSVVKERRPVKSVKEQSVEKQNYELYKTLLAIDEEYKELTDFFAKEEFKDLVDQAEKDTKKATISKQKEEALNVIRQSILTYTTEDTEQKIGVINAKEKGLTQAYIKSKRFVPPGEDLNLILVGKTGHGKSLTLNSIQKINKSNATAAPFTTVSSTTEASKQSVSIDTRVITVIDTVGVFNTELDELGIYADACRKITEGVLLCGSRFSLVLVYKYSSRLTNEEKEAISLMKTILGQDALANHAVLLVTNGDGFKADRLGTFDEWIRTEAAENAGLKYLLNECGGRYVLFDNKTSNEDIKKAQLILLVKQLDQLSRQPYSGAAFQNALAQRAELIKQKPVFLDCAEDIMNYFENQLVTGSQVDDNMKKKIKNLLVVLSEKSQDAKTQRLCDILKIINNQLDLKQIPHAKSVEKLIEAVKENSKRYQDMQNRFRKSMHSSFWKKCRIL